MFLSRPSGNLGTGISASASSLATALQKNYFCHRSFFFLKKKEVEYLCSFCAQLWYQYHFATNTQFSNTYFLFIQSKASIGVPAKSYLNIRKHPSWFFKKRAARKFLHTLHPGLSSFQVYLKAFLGLLQKALQSSYYADRDLSEQFRCALFGTKNFQLSFETES